MSETKTIAKMTGYKATDKDMKCQGHQFELGVWYEVGGELSLCHHGFHFCDYPSGPWAYYDAPGTRVFTCEAEDVLDTPVEPGADMKRVARRIRLIAEVVISGYGNTSDRNTGNWNTGDRNTGYWNTGDGNTSNRNAGYWNAGDGNTGNRNTGDGNTGNRNTGNWNTGNRNTGNWNTGNWNAGHRNPGAFCIGEPTIQCFGKDTGLTFDKFLEAFPIAYQLGEALSKDDPISIEPYKALPGITKAKLKALHEAHKAGRAQ